MGILFGRNAGSRSYTYSEKLAGKLAKKGANSSGAEALLAAMREGRDPRDLSPAEAAQAADAQAAAESGKPWRVG